MDNFNENDNILDLDDKFEDEPEVVTESKSPVDKVLDWIKNHKKEVAIGAGATTVGIILGKVFTKPEIKEVEVLPDPTLMDKYDRIPIEEHTYIDYKYILKDEYKEE